MTRAHVLSKSLMKAAGRIAHKYQNLVPLCWTHHYFFFDRGKMVILALEDWTVTARLENSAVEVTACQKVLDVPTAHLIAKNSQALPQLRALIPTVTKKVESTLLGQ